MGKKEEKTRRQYFIDKPFQTIFILKFCLIVLLSSLMIGIFLFILSQNSTTVAIENTRVAVKQTSDFILPLLIGVLLIVTLISAITVMVLTLFMSHKIAGPLFRMKREIDYLEKGDLTRDFRLRANDQLQDLARSLAEMSDAIKQNHMELRDKILVLKEYLEEKDFGRNDNEKQMLQQIIGEIEVTINYFKI